MHLAYLILLVTLQYSSCYNPKRHTQTSTSNFKNVKSKASDAVIPARYRITSTTNYEDPRTAQSFPEFFPEVEYPESVVDSSKPFYITSSPFPNDVKSTFNSLVAKEKSKAKTVTDYSWTQNEKSKEKVPVTSQKGAETEITATKGNETNTNNKGTNETLVEDIKVEDVNDEIVNDMISNTDADMDNLVKLTSTEQSDDSRDIEYVVALINDLDEVMKNFTNAETAEYIEGDHKILKNLNNTEYIKESHSVMENSTNSDTTEYISEDHEVMKNLNHTEIAKHMEEDQTAMNNLTNAEIPEYIEKDYEVMKNLTSARTPECDDSGHNSTETFESECSDEFKLSSVMTPNNNDSIIELNGNSDLTEEHPEPIRNPLFEDSDTNDTLTRFTSLFNDYSMNATAVEDMQSDLSSIGTVANETDTSYTES